MKIMAVVTDSHTIGPNLDICLLNCRGAVRMSQYACSCQLSMMTYFDVSQMIRNSNIFSCNFYGSQHDRSI